MWGLLEALERGEQFLDFWLRDLWERFIWAEGRGFRSAELNSPNPRED